LPWESPQTGGVTWGIIPLTRVITPSPGESPPLHLRGFAPSPVWSHPSPGGVTPFTWVVSPSPGGSPPSPWVTSLTCGGHLPHLGVAPSPGVVAPLTWGSPPSPEELPPSPWGSPPSPGGSPPSAALTRGVAPLTWGVAAPCPPHPEGRSAPLGGSPPPSPGQSPGPLTVASGRCFNNKAHVWWTPYAAVGVTIRIALSLSCHWNCRSVVNPRGRWRLTSGMPRNFVKIAAKLHSFPLRAQTFLRRGRNHLARCKAASSAEEVGWALKGKGARVWHGHPATGRSASGFLIAVNALRRKTGEGIFVT
jgi:hypothetical protein